MSGSVLPAVRLLGWTLQFIAQGFARDASGWDESLRREQEFGRRPPCTDVCSSLNVEATAWHVRASIATHQVRRLAPLGGPSCPYVSREALQVEFAEVTLCTIQ